MPPPVSALIGIARARRSDTPATGLHSLAYSLESNPISAQIFPFIEPVDGSSSLNRPCHFSLACYYTLRWRDVLPGQFNPTIALHHDAIINNIKTVIYRQPSSAKYAAFHSQYFTQISRHY